MKTILHLMITVLGLELFTGCSTVKVTDQQTYSTPTARPKQIYVANFDLETSDIKSEAGLLGGRIRPLHHVRVALRLVNSMADAIVSDLNKAGFPAQRIDPDAAIPTDGWLVRGVFTQVDEGNQVRRALIGFGQGKTDIQVMTVVDNLADGPPKPLYQIKTEATSGNAPGAGALIAVNPASVVVRFVLAGGDLKHNVSKTADKIASQFTHQF